MSRQYIALELLKKNGFDEDVINVAMNICGKIKSNKLIFFEDSKKKKKDNNKKVKKVKKNNKSIE